MPVEMLSETSLLKVLESVQDPDLGQSIVALGMIKDIQIDEDGTSLAFTCELTTPACPVKEKIEKEIREATGRAFPGLKRLEVKMTGKVRQAASAGGSGENLLPQIRNVIMIGSGKGGVGKSTVAVNLALALRQLGARVAVLDLDIYAPSLPLLLGRQERPKLQGESKILPVQTHGLEIMSMGFLVEPRQAMLWRGQILNGIISQFLKDVIWSEADYMLVDLPPGPGEVPLTLAQHCPAAGAVLVTTSQALSITETHRAKALFDQLRVPVLGLVENLANLANAAGLSLANELKLPLLGQIPVAPSLGSDAEVSVPVVEGKPESDAAKAFVSTAENLAAQVSIRAYAQATPAKVSAAMVSHGDMEIAES